MLKILISALALALATQAYSATRDESLNRLYQLQGYTELLANQKVSIRNEYAKEVNAAIDQAAKTYVLTDADKKKIEDINNQYLDTVTNIDTDDNYRVFWKQNYGQSFTDSEIETLVKESESPLGKKKTAEGLKLVSQMTTRYLELSTPIRTKATTDYYTALNGVFKHCACKNAPSAESSASADDESTSTLVISDVVERKVGKRVYFTGVIKNNGTKAAHAQVELNLFKNGTFVDQYNSYIGGTIAPNVSRFFKVDCECSVATMTPHDSFKTNPISSSY
jgi:hypothetical protein